MPSWKNLFKLGFFAAMGWWTWSLISTVLDIGAQWAFYVFMAS